MAYTVLATWDFRTATSATGRASRIGSYTLTQAGTPTWSSSGVDCSASASNKLTLTLPSELKISPVWWIAGMQLINATTPADYTTIVGLLKTSGAEYETSMMWSRQPSSSTLRVAIEGTHDGVGGAAYTTTGADFTVMGRRNSGNNPAFGLRINSTLTSGLITTSSVEYSGTSQLVFGSVGAQNSYMRYHWFIMGSGAITDGEVDAMLANPDSYIYGSGSSVSRAVFPFFLG